ncbi:hypothetical protein ACFX2I_002961 [Malus domestica]
MFLDSSPVSQSPSPPTSPESEPKPAYFARIRPQALLGQTLQEDISTTDFFISASLITVPVARIQLLFQCLNLVELTVYNCHWSFVFRVLSSFVGFDCSFFEEMLTQFETSCFGQWGFGI